MKRGTERATDKQSAGKRMKRRKRVEERKRSSEGGINKMTRKLLTEETSQEQPLHRG